MPAPCYESQIRDRIRATPALAKAFATEMLDHLRGGPPPGAPEAAPGTTPKQPLSYDEALTAMSEKSGLHPETINSILQRNPQIFSRTKQAIAQSGELRRMRDSANAFADQLKTQGKLQGEPGALAKAWDAQRRLALSGHSVVFPGTHAINWAIQIPTEAGIARMGAFYQAARDVWKYNPTEKGRALHEMDMGLLRAADHYNFFKSSGADIEPGKRNPGDILLQNRDPSWATRNFDTLKPMRYTALKQAWDSIDPTLKEGDAGKAVAAILARDVNYATGSVTAPVGEAATEGAKTAAQLSNLAGRYNLLMSSKLFFAKHMNAVFGPLENLAKRGGMTPAERAASNYGLRMWGNTVAAHLGILGLNYAFSKATGTATPNLTNPSDASTYMRMRIGGAVVPFSPMLEALRLPVVMTWALANKGTEGAGSVLARTIWNAAHPTAHTVASQVTGKDFMGRPVPSIRGLIQSGGQTAYVKSKSQPPVGPTEFVTTNFAPIAISGALREFYQELRNKGVSGGMASGFIKGAIAGAASGIAGRHIFEKGPEKEEKRARNR